MTVNAIYPILGAHLFFWENIFVFIGERNFIILNANILIDEHLIQCYIIFMIPSKTKNGKIFYFLLNAVIIITNLLQQ